MAIQTIHNIFKDFIIEAVFEKAFKAINMKPLPHNVTGICPITSTYISNCCNTIARLFIIGEKEILSKEETRQGDPTAIAACALGVTPFIQHLLGITSSNKLHSKEIAFEDYFTVAGSIKDIKWYWEHLNSFSTFFGYYPKASKSKSIQNHLKEKSQW